MLSLAKNWNQNWNVGPESEQRVYSCARLWVGEGHRPIKSHHFGFHQSCRLKIPPLLIEKGYGVSEKFTCHVSILMIYILIDACNLSKYYFWWKSNIIWEILFNSFLILTIILLSLWILNGSALFANRTKSKYINEQHNKYNQTVTNQFSRTKT